MGPPQVVSGRLGPDSADNIGRSCWRRTSTTPAVQPGCRPPAGGTTASASRSARSKAYDVSELVFHISPVRFSSRPQSGRGPTEALW